MPLHARPPTAADLDTLAVLVNRSELGGEAELEPKTRAALASELSSPQVDPARDQRVWCDDAGQIRGFARLRVEPSGSEVHGRLHYSIAHRSDRQLEAAVIRWAAVRLAEEAGPVRLLHSVAVRDPGRAARLARLGFSPHRPRLSLGRSTAAALPDAPLPAGYRIRPCRGAPEAEGYVAACNEAFSDAHDYSPLTVAEFLHDTASPGYRPERNLIAEDAAGEIAGFCTAVVETETPTLGFVAILGVRPQHRGRGLGAALLAHAIATLRAEGVCDVHLNADADNPTGAVGLYERMGFATRFAETRYALDDAAVRALADR